MTQAMLHIYHISGARLDPLHSRLHQRCGGDSTAGEDLLCTQTQVAITLESSTAELGRDRGEEVSHIRQRHSTGELDNSSMPV